MVAKCLMIDVIVECDHLEKIISLTKNSYLINTLIIMHPYTQRVYKKLANTNHIYLRKVDCSRYIAFILK
jgi:hypothetical protein